MDQSWNWSAKVVRNYYSTGEEQSLTEVERKSIDAQICSIVDILLSLRGLYLPYHVVRESDFVD
jgi:hypothetical protein